MSPSYSTAVLAWVRRQIETRSRNVIIWRISCPWWISWIRRGTLLRLSVVMRKQCITIDLCYSLCLASVCVLLTENRVVCLRLGWHMPVLAFSPTCFLFIPPFLSLPLVRARWLSDCSARCDIRYLLGSWYLDSISSWLTSSSRPDGR